MKIKNRYITATIIILCITSLNLVAQTKYNIENCKEMAIENNRKIKNSRLDIDASKQTKKEAFTNYFPSVSTSGMGLLPKDPLMSLNLAGMSLGLLDKGFEAGITATQPIFAGGKIVTGNKLADLGTEVNQYQVKLKKNEVQSNRMNLKNGIKLVKMSMCQLMGLELSLSDNFDIAVPDIESVKSPIVYYVDHSTALS